LTHYVAKKLKKNMSSLNMLCDSKLRMAFGRVRIENNHTITPAPEKRLTFMPILAFRCLFVFQLKVCMRNKRSGKTRDAVC